MCQGRIGIKREKLCPRRKFGWQVAQTYEKIKKTLFSSLKNIIRREDKLGPVAQSTYTFHDRHKNIRNVFLITYICLTVLDRATKQTLFEVKLCSQDVWENKVCINIPTLFQVLLIIMPIMKYFLALQNIIRLARRAWSGHWYSNIVYNFLYMYCISQLFRTDWLD